MGRTSPLLLAVGFDSKLLDSHRDQAFGGALAENLADVTPYPEGQDVIRPMDKPIKPDSHLAVLYGP